MFGFTFFISLVTLFLWHIGLVFIFIVWTRCNVKSISLNFNMITMYTLIVSLLYLFIYTNNKWWCNERSKRLNFNTLCPLYVSTICNVFTLIQCILFLVRCSDLLPHRFVTFNILENELVRKRTANRYERIGSRLSGESTNCVTMVQRMEAKEPRLNT